jgi:SpoVK/Ycf46/Vps4 family AAA+-type ATPase
MKSEFFSALDGLITAPQERLLVLGATNRCALVHTTSADCVCRPYDLDEAARRRFTQRLYIALPDAQARTMIVGRLLKPFSNTVDESQLAEIADATDGAV